MSVNRRGRIETSLLNGSLFSRQEEGEKTERKDVITTRAVKGPIAEINVVSNNGIEL